MVKILVILGGLGREGITSSVLTYLEAMDKNEIDLHLGIAGNAQPEMLERANNIGIALHILPGRNLKPIPYFFALKKLVTKEAFDIVHVHGNSATLGLDLTAARLGGCPIRIAHSHSSSCTHPIMSGLMKPLFYANCTTRFACGMAAGQWMFKDRSFQIIPNGKQIALFLFNPQIRMALRQKYNAQDKIVIGHVGAFTEVKNHAFLIDVFNRICRTDDRYVLWLIGEKNENMRQIQKKTEMLGIKDKVAFLGFQSHVEQYLCAMDIAALPSLYEGFPNVVIEWQISGLPCVLSDRITRDCCFMDDVSYLPLEAGPDVWAEAIKSIEIRDRNEKQDIILKKTRNAGLDIKQNAAYLKRLYFQLAIKKG